MKKYKVKDLVKEISERENSPATSVYKRFVGLEHYESGNVEIKQSGSVDQLESSMKIFQDGDILIARRNVYLRRAGVVHFSGLTSGDSIVLRPLNQDLKDILPFVFNSDSFWDFANRFADGTMSKRLSPKTLMEFVFELPEGDDLKKLTDTLWTAYALKESYKHLLTASDEMAKSRFVEMFGDPIDNPMIWPKMPLSSLGDLNRGVSKARPRNSPDLLGGPYPLIQTGEVTNSDTYITDYTSTYSEKGLAQSKMWPKGTLCITIAANIAQTGILSFDACFPDSVVGFLSGPKVTQLYVHFWFKFFQKVLEEQAPQVAQKNINLKILGDLLVMVPPLTLQEEFVEFVEQLDKSKVALKECIDNIDTLVKSLLNTINSENTK